MKKITLLLALGVFIATPGSLAADEASADADVKRLPNLIVEDPVAPKTLKNADNSDLDPELRAILEEAEEAENAQD